MQRNPDEKYKHKDKTERFCSKPATTPSLSHTTISLLQLSRRIKLLEDKVLKCTSQKTIVKRFQNWSLFLLLGEQEEILLFLYRKHLRILLGERQVVDVLGFLFYVLYCFIVIPNKKFVQLAELRDIYGRKFSLAWTRTEKEKKANFLIVWKYASNKAG